MKRSWALPMFASFGSFGWLVQFVHSICLGLLWFVKLLLFGAMLGEYENFNVSAALRVWLCLVMVLTIMCQNMAAEK